MPSRTSVIAQAIFDRTIVHVRDFESDDGFAQTTASRTMVQAVGYRSLLAVPMLRDDRPIGAIAVGRPPLDGAARPFSDRDIDLLKTFAEQAVIAIKNTRLFEAEQASKRELQESLEYQTATSEVLSVISQSPNDLQPVLEAIVETARRLCQSDRAMYFQLLEDRYHLVAERGTDPEFLAWVRDNPMSPELGSGSTVGRAARERRTIHVPDLAGDPEYNESPIQRRGRSRSRLAVPLLRGDVVFGVILVARDAVRPFTDRQIKLVETFADQAVIAIENTRLFEAEQASRRELQESLEYQTATSEVLNVMSRSPAELQPVLDAIAATAARLCESVDAQVWRVQGGGLVMVAQHGPLKAERRLPATRGTVTGRAVIDQKTIHVHDLSALVDTEYPDAKGPHAAVGHRTTLATPLVSTGESLGAILLRKMQVDPFSDRQIALLQTFADQAVIAIENARLFEEVRARTRELTESLEQQTATSDILRVIAGTPDDAQPVFDAIAQSALRLFGVSHVSIMLREADWVRCKATAGSSDPRGDFLIPLERNSTSGRAILDRAVISISDTEARDAPSFARESGRVVGFRAMAVAPMLREGIAIGSGHMMRQTPRPFTNTQIELLKTFADQAVIAIENARLFDQVQLRTRELARSVEELQALGEVGRAVSSTLDLKVVLKTIVERAVQLSGTNAGSIFYYRKELGTFELGETTGLSEEFVARLRKLDIPAKETGPGEAIARRQPLQVPDLLQRPSEPLRDAVLEAGFSASLLVALL